MPVDSLTPQQKTNIMKDLQFESSKNKQWVHSFHVDEESDTIYLPYGYARTLGFRPKSRIMYPNVNFTFTGKLRDYQIDDKAETLAELTKKGSCVLALHVGRGKSILSIYIATKLKFKTLIIVNRLILIKQWTDLITTVCPESKCQLVKTKSILDPECDFYIINALNVSKMTLSFFETIGTLIVDEIHLICASTLYKALFYISPRYLLGLSATPYRPDGLGRLIELFFGDFQIIKPLFRHHTVFTIHTNLKIKYELTWDGKMDWNSVLNYQAELAERNQMIVDVICKHSERYFLVLCKRVAHGKVLVKMLEDQKESVTDLLGSKKEFNEDARIVVATGQKCGVGFSHDKLDALLLASDMEEYFIQYLGRVFRTPEVEPIIFDFVDSLPTLMRHYQTRKAVYKKCGGKIQEISNTKMFLN